MTKNRTIKTTNGDVEVELMDIHEVPQAQKEKWYHVSRAGLVEAAKTIKDLLPILIYVIHKLSEL